MDNGGAYTSTSLTVSVRSWRFIKIFLENVSNLIFWRTGDCYGLELSGNMHNFTATKLHDQQAWFWPEPRAITACNLLVSGLVSMTKGRKCDVSQIFRNFRDRISNLILLMMSTPDCSSSVFLTKLRGTVIFPVPALISSLRRLGFRITWGQRPSAVSTINSKRLWRKKWSRNVL